MNYSLAQQANISGATTTNAVIEQPFVSPATLAAGQAVFLGIGFTGTSLQIKGAFLPAAMAALTPALGRSGVWAGGAFGSIAGAPTGNLAWIELI